MSRAAVARNYAEALFELAAGEEASVNWGELLEAVAALYRDEPDLRQFLDTPRVPVDEKRQALREALGAGAPERLVRFLLVVLEKRRQRAIPEIAAAYADLLDEEASRVRATVSLPFEPDEALREEVVGELERALGMTVVARFRREPDLIGGIRVRVGDRVMDGSLRRRLEEMRKDLVATGHDGAEG